MTKPEQTASYLGRITDTSRWTNFRHRPDDIFICTPPKCGTTWTQAICAMLVFGKVDHGTQPGIISPWIDAQFAPIEDYLKQVEAQQHRRFIKTHTPLDGIPYYENCTYLVVFRDPRDAFCSGINHRDNMNDQELANSAFPSGPTAFNDWLSHVREPGSTCHDMQEGAARREVAQDVGVRHPEVGVDEADLLAEAAHRDREVHGDIALAHAPFARGDGDRTSEADRGRYRGGGSCSLRSWPLS